MIRKVYLIGFMMACLFAAAAGKGQAQTAAAPTGNIERGKVAYQQTYKCYSCHGTSGETGSPRLVPMGRTQADFIAFVKKGSAGMPQYPELSEATLADIYAYIKSIPSTAQPVEKIPLLNELLKKAK